MPPKKKQKVADEEDDGTSMVMYEQVALDRLYSVAMLFIDNPAEDEQIMKYFLHYQANKLSRLKVVYKPKDPLDRVYAQGPNMQSMPNWIQRLVLHEVVHDIDMAKCGNMIVHQLLTKAIGWAPAWNKRYIDDREDLLEAWLHKGIPLTAKTLKAIMQHVTCLGKVRSRAAEWDLPEGVRYQPFHELQKDFRRAFEELSVHAEFSAIFTKCTIDEEVVAITDDKKRKTAALRKFAAMVIRQREIILLKAMHEHLTKTEKLHVSILQHDGLKVERVKPFPELLNIDILRKTEEYVLSSTGYKIELVEKSIAPTEDDWKRFNGPRCLNKMLSSEEKAREVVVSEAYKRHYMRRGDDVVKPHPTIPGVTLTVMKLTAFLQQAFSDRNFEISPKEMRQVEDWCLTCPDKRFPLQQKPTTRYINFINGCLNLDSEEWCFYEEMKETPYTNHYFETVVTEDDLRGLTPTPLWDQLIDIQMSQEIKSILEGMIGRLFYPVSKDNGGKDDYQVMPYCVGAKNTGKSTVVAIVADLFPPDDVGCISQNFEGTFGLSMLHTKRLIVCTDVPAKLSEKLASSDLQSMITGEKLSVAKKNKDAITTKNWAVPLFMAANFMLKYDDEYGAIGRRVAAFQFRTRVPDRDTTLKHRLLATEAVPLLLRFLLRYKDLREMVGNGDFWKKVPASFVDVNTVVKTNGNPLAEFLDYGSSRHLVERVEGAFTAYQTLSDCYTNYMKFYHRIDKSKLPDDDDMFSSRGYEKTRWHWCDRCENKTDPDRCQGHYVGPKKGPKPYVFVNLRLTKFAPPHPVMHH
jgi:phage/plasmid-associated DNA primase